MTESLIRFLLQVLRPAGPSEMCARRSFFAKSAAKSERGRGTRAACVRLRRHTVKRQKDREVGEKGRIALVERDFFENVLSLEN